ncbi:MAG: fibronectin type III domain-containing protein, partial [Planctomycetia bacterium]|nr:fibronectin type III domain-containing protein [Planctomycetia bacterium]
MIAKNAVGISLASANSAPATPLAPALTPAFGSTAATSTGFTVQVTNYNALYTWAGTATASGTVAINGTGLVTVTNVAPNTSSTATITTTRTGYTGGTAQVTATSLAGATVPGAPTSVVATSGNAQLFVTWTAPASTGGSAITDYLVKYSRDNGATWTTFVDPVSTATSCTVTGLINGTPYVIKVIAK